MNTLILIMFIYFVMQLLRRAAQGQQQPRQDLPEYRPSREDAPLPGPWNRRTETEAEPSLPGPWDIPGEPRGDTPLPGPWEKKSPRERPVETKTEPRWEPEFEPEPGYEPGPVQEKRYKPQPEARPHDRGDELVRIPEPRRGTDAGAPVPRREVFPGPSGECEAVSPQGRRAAAMQEPLRRRRRKCRVNPLTAVLSSQSTLVGSMVLGQVLGTRGGLAGERKKPPSKNF